MILELAAGQGSTQSFGQVFAAGALGGALVGAFSLLGVMLNGKFNREADERRIAAERAAAKLDSETAEQHAINSEGRLAIAALVGVAWEFMVVVAHRDVPEEDIIRRFNAAYGLVAVSVDRSVQKEAADVVKLINTIENQIRKTRDFDSIETDYRKLLKANQDLTNAVRARKGVELIKFAGEDVVDDDTASA